MRGSVTSPGFGCCEWFYGQSSPYGFLHSRIDILEREYLFRKAFLYRPVVHGPQYSVVEGDGVHAHSGRFEIGLIGSRQVCVEIFPKYILSLTEAHEAVERTRVGLAGAHFA